MCRMDVYKIAKKALKGKTVSRQSAIGILADAFNVDKDEKYNSLMGIFASLRREIEQEKPENIVGNPLTSVVKYKF